MENPCNIKRHMRSVATRAELQVHREFIARLMSASNPSVEIDIRGLENHNSRRLNTRCLRKGSLPRIILITNFRFAQ